MSRPELIGAAADLPLNGHPGSTFEYNNINLVLAAHVLEKVTGQTWENEVQANIMNPLGWKTGLSSC